ncbi:hypothetical protein ACDZ94_22410 [Pseudomonas sp. UBT]|uniref:hypothetical protein n=1 Tax=Pseudomonas sp. UBT TaxID=3239198 RepID=UPI003D80156C
MTAGPSRTDENNGIKHLPQPFAMQRAEASSLEALRANDWVFDAGYWRGVKTQTPDKQKGHSIIE